MERKFLSVVKLNNEPRCNWVAIDLHDTLIRYSAAAHLRCAVLSHPKFSRTIQQAGTRLQPLTISFEHDEQQMSRRGTATARNVPY